MEVAASPTVRNKWTISGLVVELRVGREDLNYKIAGADLKPCSVEGVRGIRRYYMADIFRLLLGVQEGKSTTSTLAKEKLRLAKEHADQATRKSKVEVGELVHVEQALIIWEGCISAFKSKINSVDRQLAQLIQNIENDEDKAEAIQMAEDLHREALDELSGIHAADYKSGQRGVVSAKASKTSDRQPVG